MIYRLFAHGIVQGEYAAFPTNKCNLHGSESQGKSNYPSMQTSTAEAAFMTGLERNSDIVFASCYAPVLQVCGSLYMA